MVHIADKKIIIHSNFMGEKKLLFVEDEAALQKSFGDFLGQKGYKVISAVDGEQGIKLAKAERPDLILLDLILPRKNGFEVLENLKKDDSTREIPVIVLTNLEEMENIEKALNLGATAYLVKTNYSLEEVLIKVERTLET